MDTLIFPSTTELFLAAAEDFAYRAIAAVVEKGFFTVVLSGGNTPKLFFDILSKHQHPSIPWSHIWFFFGDERYVPSYDQANNYHMTQEHLFSKVDVTPKHIYPIPTDYNDPKEAAKHYEKTLEIIPYFDLVYLGLGDDAHTASLMPDNETVMQYTHEGNTQRVIAIWVSKLKQYRISLTPIALNNSHAINFLVTGSEKAHAVKAVLQDPKNVQYYPAQLINCQLGKTTWYLEKAAAKLLKGSN